MSTSANRIAAGLAVFALGIGVAACSDRESQGQGNPGGDPASGDTVLRTAQTAAPGNAPVAPTTPAKVPGSQDGN
jgi:hypothetical protein